MLLTYYLIFKSSFIQIIVDELDIKGHFILTGSHQLQLHQAITQSLAGRTALLTLLPLSIQELKMSNISFALDELLLNGGYPRIYKDQLNPTIAYKNYFQTYIERDVRQIINVKNLALFQKIIKICAGRVGQILSYEGMVNDVGISANTIKEWISVLEASFIVFRLEPYFENFGKRLIKSPKIYFTDVGFVSYLLNIENISQIQRDPLRGHLIENLVILELMKARFNMGIDHHLYYYRDQAGHEVDVIYQKGHQLVPIEIKAASTYHTSFLKNLHYFSELSPSRVEQSYLVYTGDLEHTVESTKVVNYQNIAQVMFEA